MLIGEYDGKLVDKNRTALPKNLRMQLGEHAILTRGYENSLILLSNELWDQLLARIESKPFFSLNVRETKRFLASGATVVNFDAQGRFVIPNNLFDYANIQKELVFVGVIDWVEIWDANTWYAKRSNLLKHATQIATNLESISKKT